MPEQKFDRPASDSVDYVAVCFFATQFVGPRSIFAYYKEILMALGSPMSISISASQQEHFP